jgi:catechol 2,3-dioxygenase-like lactoylglutathione lyase family enzyme
MTTHHLSHIGICVSDLEHSLRFYRDLLGFAEVSSLQMQGPITERLLEIEGGEMEAVYLVLSGTCIELLYYPVAGHLPAQTPRPMNRLGFTHLSLRVADLDGVVSAVKHAGGGCLEHTRLDMGAQNKAVFVTDPDGLRIELVQSPGDMDALPGT